MLLRTFVLPAAVAAVVMFAAGAAQAALFAPQTNRDALFSSDFSDGNAGGAPNLVVGSHQTAGVQRALIGFDLSDLAGQYSQITDVTLQLFIGTAGGVGNDDKTVQVYEVKSANDDWVEGTLTDGNVAQPGSSSWAYKIHNTETWTGGAGLGEINEPVDASDGYGPDILASEPIAGGTSYPAENTPVLFEFTGTPAELTALVDSWFVNHDDEITFLLRSPNEGTGNNRVQFRSKEYVDPDPNISRAPQLLITYETAVAVVPEPSTFALLGLGALVWAVGAYRRRCRR